MAALFQAYQRPTRLVVTTAVAAVLLIAVTLALVLTLTPPTPQQQSHEAERQNDRRMLAAFANTFAAEQAVADFAAGQKQLMLTTMAAALHQQLLAGADTVTLFKYATQSLRLEAIYLLDVKRQTVALWGLQSQPESFREAPEVRERLNEAGAELWLRRVNFPTKSSQPFYVLIWPRPQVRGFVVMVQTPENYQQYGDWSSLYTKFLESFMEVSSSAVYIAVLEPGNQINYVVGNAAEVGRLKRNHKSFKTLTARRTATAGELTSTRGEALLEVTQPYFAAGENPASGVQPRGVLIAGFRMQSGSGMPNIVPAIIIGTFASVVFIGLMLWLCRGTAESTATRLEGDTQNILESFSNGLLAINSDAVVVAVNRRAEEITGYARAAILGQPYQRGFENEKELNYVLMDTLHNGKIYENHELTFHKADNTAVPLRITTSQLELSGSQHPGAVVLMEDLSEQRRLEARLRRNERLSAMGQLAHGVAHEIRNPLNAIEMTAQHVQGEFSPAEPAAREKFNRYLRAVREEVRRLDQIVRRFLELARPPETSLSAVDVNALVEHALLVEAEEFSRHKIKVVKNLATQLPPIQADKGQLQQALLNLIINAVQAIDALPDKHAPRLLTVGTAFVPAEAADEADGVEITLSDTGVGIKPEHREKIFDPYFTTKPGGSGLGLAVVHSITLNHGGLVEMESAPGAGTTIRWLLPVEFGETL